MASDERVVPFKKGALIPGIRYEPNPDIVAELEWLLGAAKAGELAGLAYAILWSDLNVGNRYVGRISRSEVGALFAVMSRVSAQIDEDTKNNK